MHLRHLNRVLSPGNLGCALAMMASCGLVWPCQAVNVDDFIDGAAEGRSLGMDIKSRLETAQVADSGPLYVDYGVATNRPGESNSFVIFRRKRDNSGDASDPPKALFSGKEAKLAALIDQKVSHLKFFVSQADNGGLNAIKASLESTDVRRQQGNADGREADHVKQTITVGTGFDFDLEGPAQANASSADSHEQGDVRGGTDDKPGLTGSLTSKRFVVPGTEAFPNWLYEVGEETEIDGTLFLGGDAGFVFKEANTMISDAHVSPYKNIAFGLAQEMVSSCATSSASSDCDQTNKQAAGFGVVALFGLGLAGFGWLRLRKRS